jgi:hypothetical protein
MEYFILIIEFFYIKGFKGIIGGFVLPALLGYFFYKCGSNCDFEKNYLIYNTNIITLLGILIGFTISTFTLLLTVNNENIEKAKNHLIGKKIFSRSISLYDTVIIGLAYLILIQGILLIFNFAYPLFISTESNYNKLLYAINVSIVIHIIILLMRCILDFYFILTKKK